MFLQVARLSILLAEQEKNFSYLAQILRHHRRYSLRGEMPEHDLQVRQCFDKSAIHMHKKAIYHIIFIKVMLELQLSNFE